MKNGGFLLVACLGVSGVGALPSLTSNIVSSTSSASTSSVTAPPSSTDLSPICSGIPNSDYTCPNYFYCYINYYTPTPIYQCALITTLLPTTAVNPYGQCGGIGYQGLTNCLPGYTCVRENDYFSNCFPITSTSSVPMSSSAPQTTIVTTTTTPRTTTTAKVTLNKTTKKATTTMKTHKPWPPVKPSLK
jgi:hypothetical protein